MTPRSPLAPLLLASLLLGLALGAAACDPETPPEMDAGPEEDGGAPTDAEVGCTEDAHCDDDNACTEDVCGDDGTCAYTDVVCDDGIGCTADSCDPRGGCANAPDDALCDDGVFCNGAEACDVDGGGCAAGSLDLSDGVSCTVDACDEDADTITHSADDAACDDGMFCNGVETCDATLGCRPGALPIDDGVDCTFDGCDEATDTVAHAPVHEACDDGMFCNGVETCDVALGCQAGADPAPDSIPCTVDGCDEATDTITHTPDHAACDDGLFCNGAETCSAALGCQAGADPVPDLVPCTVDSCDEATDTIAHTPDDTACDDGLFCNGAETCSPTLGCRPGADPRDDGIACTTGSCDEPTDTVTQVPNAAVCTDRAWCNGEEVCDTSLGCQPASSGPSLPSPVATDTFGYAAYSSVTAGASCTHVFTDISATGTALAGGDDVRRFVDAPAGSAGFTLYGTTATRVVMSTNGWVSWNTAQSTDFANACGTITLSGGGISALIFHDDLRDTTMHYQRFATCPRAHDFAGPQACHIFQWTDVFRRIDSANVWDMQMILYEGSGDVVYAYSGATHNTGATSTTGIVDSARSHTLQIGCDTAGTVPHDASFCVYNLAACGGG